MQLVEKCGIESAQVPIDINAAAKNGTFISLKNFNHVTVVIVQGAWAGGTPALTARQAPDVAGTAAKAAPLSFYWQKAAVAAGQFTKTAVVSNTFNLPATANTVTVLEIDAEELDVTNGFDCFQIQSGTPGANADLLSMFYILSEPRYNGAGITMPDAKID